MEFTEKQFFFDIPIYTPIEINSENLSCLKTILSPNGPSFDGYNPFNQFESTFVIKTGLRHNSDHYLNMGGHALIRIECKRTNIEFHYYIFWDKDTNKLVKTGQYPSVADLHISEIKKYKKLLSTEKLKEFTRAIGLAANGVGIGSFVYLRRIFENLISEAYEACLAASMVTEEEFQKARMKEKIELLSSQLPDFLVENKSIYSILSLGIHELDEATCLAYFDTLKVGIEIILDEKLDELRKTEKLAEAKAKLGELNGQTKTS
jgi:hypothetical protein